MEQELQLLILNKKDLAEISRLRKELYFVRIIDDTFIVLGALPNVFNKDCSYFKYLKDMEASLCFVVGDGKDDKKMKQKYKDRIVKYNVNKYDPEVNPKIGIADYNNVNYKIYKIAVKQYNRNDNECQPRALAR
ncbi:MAG: hypothetical protein PHY26_02430 [Bacilli bacterium]|jgi:calcineurin-like phosphoesterase family protein|nr:hypothetical protein [Bacilli bacterium]